MSTFSPFFFLPALFKPGIIMQPVLTRVNTWLYMPGYILCSEYDWISWMALCSDLNQVWIQSIKRDHIIKGEKSYPATCERSPY